MAEDKDEAKDETEKPRRATRPKKTDDKPAESQDAPNQEAKSETQQVKPISDDGSSDKVTLDKVAGVRGFASASNGDEVEHRLSAPKGQIVKSRNDVKLDGEEVGNEVRIKEDIWLETYPNGSKRPSYRLLFSKNVPLTPAQVNAIKR